MLHKYYEPTEYEQMLIAARWVSIEDLDPDYLEYRKNCSDDYELSYESWTNMRKEWDRLNQRYLQEVEPFELDSESYTRQVAVLSKELLNQMSEIEYLLAY